MKQILVFWLLVLGATGVLAQKHDQIWIAGIQSSYQFPKDCPWCTRVMTFSDTGIHYLYVKNFIEMRASTPITISDKEGNLLFYTNGNLIASHTHEIMENGSGLNAGSPFSHVHVVTGDSLDSWSYPSACYMVFPDPEDENIYYMLHTYLLYAALADSVPDGYQVYSDKLQITKIDMSANNGLGKVVYKDKPLLEGISSYHLNAVQHGNGRDWWVLVSNIDVSSYHVLHLSKDSLIQVFTQSVPLVAEKPYDFYDSLNLAANLTIISPDGKILIDRDGQKGVYRLFDFDRCIGTIQFRDTLNFGIAIFNSLDTGIHKDVIYEEGYRDISFSPNSKYLYAGSINGYWQYDLEASDILASGIKLSGPPIVMEDLTQEPILWQVYIPVTAPGPDGKLYALWRANHHVVNQPNEKGMAADFCLAYEQPPSCLNVPHHLFSPWYPNYRLGALKGSDCDTIISSVLTEQAETYGLRIYPNPSSGLTYFDITLPDYASSATRVVVYDLWGREVYNHTYPEYAYMHTMDTSSLPGGMYVVKLYQGELAVASERLVVSKE